MKKIVKHVGLACAALLVMNFAINTTSVSSVDAAGFKSCKTLLKKHKSGIAVSKAKKKKTKATVNAALYRQNKALDINGDGIVCDKGDLGAGGSWAPVDYAGVGSYVQDIKIPKGQPAVLQVTHQGNSNFIVWGLNKSLEQNDLLVNEIGDYSGTVFVNRGFSFSPTETTGLEIDADGAWTVRVSPASKAPMFKRRASGVGDSVLRYDGRRIKVKVSHDGASNFVITTYNSKGLYSNLVVNEIGPYEGTVILPADSYIAIDADGNWSISK